MPSVTRGIRPYAPCQYDAETKTTTMEPAVIKSLFRSKGTVTVRWSDGTGTSKMAQKDIDVTQAAEAKKKHEELLAEAKKASDDSGDGESDILSSDDASNDDEPAKKKSRKSQRQQKPKKA